MDFMWSVPDFDFWRKPLDHSIPKLQPIIKRNFILKIAISKKIVINWVKDELKIILVGRLQNQNVTAYLSLFYSITIAFKCSNWVIHISTTFIFPRNLIFFMFKPVLHTFWNQSREELGALLRIFSGFLMKYSRTPLIRTPKGPQTGNGLS